MAGPIEVFGSMIEGEDNKLLIGTLRHGNFWRMEAESI